MASTGQKVLSGATSGAGVGTAIMPGVGTAIGAGLGALAGGLSSIGSDPYKKYVKEQFARLNATGTTLSDEERRQIGRETVEGQSQIKAAQDLGAQRQAMALTGGSPILAGQQKQSAKELGEATRDIAVKSSSQKEKMAMALDERRKARLEEMMRGVQAQKEADEVQNVQAGLAAADAAAEIAKLV
jgi:hypothetical protein